MSCSKVVSSKIQISREPQGTAPIYETSPTPHFPGFQRNFAKSKMWTFISVFHWRNLPEVHWWLDFECSFETCFMQVAVPVVGSGTKLWWKTKQRYLRMEISHEKLSSTVKSRGYVSPSTRITTNSILFISLTKSQIWRSHKLGKFHRK